MTAEGAVLANQTRQERAAIDRLRNGHFTRPEKDETRERVLDFLQDYMEPEDKMGDLLGPGWSAMAAVERGINVVAAENLSWSGGVLGGNDLARRAASRMAAEGGFEVVIGPKSFASILTDVTTAFYDPCGPPIENWANDIHRMAEAGLRAFAATCLLSRVDGGKGLGSRGYTRIALGVIEDQAPKYETVDTIAYSGESNLPMAVLFVRRKEYGAKYLYQAAYQAAYRATPESRAYQAAYQAAYGTTPDQKARRAAYEATPERKARQSARRATPEYRAKKAAYYAANPEFRERQKATVKSWREVPENRDRINNQGRLRRATPEARAKRAAYARELRARQSMVAA